MEAKRVQSLIRKLLFTICFTDIFLWILLILFSCIFFFSYGFQYWYRTQKSNLFFSPNTMTIPMLIIEVSKLSSNYLKCIVYCILSVYFQIISFTCNFVGIPVSAPSCFKCYRLIVFCIWQDMPYSSSFKKFWLFLHALFFQMKLELRDCHCTYWDTEVFCKMNLCINFGEIDSSSLIQSYLRHKHGIF